MDDMQITTDRIKLSKDMCNALVKTCNEHLAQWRALAKDSDEMQAALTINAIANFCQAVATCMSPEYEEVAQRICHTIMRAIDKHTASIAALKQRETVGGVQ